MTARNERPDSIASRYVAVESFPPETFTTCWIERLSFKRRDRRERRVGARLGAPDAWLDVPFAQGLHSPSFPAPSRFRISPLFQSPACITSNSRIDRACKATACVGATLANCARDISAPLR